MEGVINWGRADSSYSGFCWTDWTSTATSITKGWTGNFKNGKETDPIENGGPALHGDTLEDGEHGKDNVVEAGDPLVRALPVLQAD